MIFIETRDGCLVNLDHVIKIERRGFDIAFVTARDTEYISDFTDEAACRISFAKLHNLLCKEVKVIITV